jgi:hypothetical protein
MQFYLHVQTMRHSVQVVHMVDTVVRLLSPVINFFDCDNLLSAHFKTDRKTFTSEIHSESSCNIFASVVIQM